MSWASLVAQVVKTKSACNAGDLGSIPRLGRVQFPWGGEGLVSPVFLPEEFHGQRSLVSYS